MSHSPFVDSRSRARFVMLATLLGVVLSGALFVGGLVSAIDAFEEASWSEVRADVVNVAISESPYQTSNGMSRVGTRIEVTYRFVVDGRAYTSSRYATDEPYDEYSEGSTAAAERIDYLTKHKQVTAFVPLQDPSRAVLEREELVPAVIVTAAGALTLLLVIVFFIRWRLGRKKVTAPYAAV